nr:hypothetical transcript [Hymenolepis microstoma]
MQRSILSFFSKASQKPKERDELEKEDSGACSSSFIEDQALKRPVINDSESDGCSPIKRTTLKKRRVIVESSDEEEVENLPVISKSSQNDKSIADLYSCTNKSFGRDVTNSPKAINSPTRNKSLVSKSLNKSLLDASAPDSLNNSMAESSFAMDPLEENRYESWPHLTYPFLQPDRIKDACGRRPNHPDYDPRTLFVPEDFLRKQSPGLRQWWILKSQNYDTLLFFKMGKFYELYHMDAVAAVEELKLSYMKGEMAHAGFPEIAFQRMANRLLQKASWSFKQFSAKIGSSPLDTGYKVARIEQTETPEGMAKRTCGRAGADKVVRREICQIITPGTWFAPLRNGISPENNVLDTSVSVASSLQGANQSEIETDLSYNRHLMVILEAPGKEKSEIYFGVALLKATTGEILVSCFILANLGYRQ